MDIKKYSFKSEEDNHWEYCKQNKIPFIQIRILDKEFCSLEYDLLPMITFNLSIEPSLIDEMNKLYNAYSSFTFLPKKSYSAIGGSNSFSMCIFQEHSGSLAEKLFDFLIHYVKEHKVSTEDIYHECISKTFQNHHSLREVFDPYCSEFENTTDEKRLKLLRQVVSTYDLAEVVGGYCDYYSKEKPHVTHNIRNGLIHNLGIIQRQTETDEDVLPKSIMLQMNPRDLTGYLQKLLLDRISTAVKER